MPCDGTKPDDDDDDDVVDESCSVAGEGCVGCEVEKKTLLFGLSPFFFSANLVFPVIHVDISVEPLTPLKKPRGTLDSEKFFGGRNLLGGAKSSSRGHSKSYKAGKNEGILHVIILRSAYSYHAFKGLHANTIQLTIIVNASSSSLFVI